MTVGHDRALDFHRKLGKPSLYLLLAHGSSFTPEPRSEVPDVATAAIWPEPPRG
jgi:hypothetical protein